MRACARFDAARVAGAIEAGKASAGALLGRGHLAMTIDQGADMSRYQGLVALEGGSLEDAAHEYFKSSEQIPTRVRLAVGEEMSPGAGHRWRAGGMLLQFLPKARSARGCPTSIPAMRRKARPRMSSPKTTPGPKAAP